MITRIIHEFTRVIVAVCCYDTQIVEEGTPESPFPCRLKVFLDVVCFAELEVNDTNILRMFLKLEERIK